MAQVPYAKLSPANQKVALAKWHARQDAKTPLTAQQQRAAALAQVVAPGLTRAQLNKSVAADTTMKFGGQEADLRGQPARLDAAFAAYQNAINNASRQTTGSGPQLGGSYGGAVQGVQNLQGGLNQAAKDQWAGQQASQAADAASRGATADASLADVAHNASNVRNILTGSYGAMLTGEGANARKSFADRGVSAQQQLGEQKAGVSKALGQLLEQKGAFKTSDAQTIVSNTFSNALKQALEQSQAAQAGATTAKTNAETGLTAAKTAFLKRFGRLPGTSDPNSTTAKLDQARLDYFNKHGYFPPTGPPKPAKTGPAAVTPLQKTSRTSDFRKVLADVKTTVKSLDQHHPAGWGPTKTAVPGVLAPMTTQQKVAYLRNLIGPDYSSTNFDIVTAAIQQGVLGHVGPNTRKALTRLGVDQAYWN